MIFINSKLCGIYSITSKTDGKRYIGQTIVSFEKRWKRHKHDLNKGIHKNPHLQSSWNKYGDDNFDFEIIEECIEINTDEAEIFWIFTFRTLNNEYGYNIKTGGKNGRMSEESKDKLSKSQMGNQNTLGLKHSEKTKLKISLIHKGKPKRPKTDSEVQAFKLARNGKKMSNNISGYIGVSWDKDSNKWVVNININDRQKFIGRYSNVKDAAKIHDRAYWKTYQNTALLNFPNDNQYKIDIIIPNKQKLSKYNGITKRSTDKKWLAKININGEHNNLGRFIDEIEAAKAYDKASFGAFGITNKLNFPEDYISKEFLHPSMQLNNDVKVPAYSTE